MVENFKFGKNKNVQIQVAEQTVKKINSQKLG